MSHWCFILFPLFIIFRFKSLAPSMYTRLHTLLLASVSRFIFFLFLSIYFISFLFAHSTGTPIFLAVLYLSPSHICISFLSAFFLIPPQLHCNPQHLLTALLSPLNPLLFPLPILSTTIMKCDDPTFRLFPPLFTSYFLFPFFFLLLIYFISVCLFSLLLLFYSFQRG